MPRPSQRGFNLKLANGELSSEAKQLIAQIKCTAKEQAKQEIISEIDIQKNSYSENQKDKCLNHTVYEDYSEIKTLKIENQLLKQLNNYLLDKNRILNELLTNEKQRKNNKFMPLQKLHPTQNQKAKECQS